MEKAVLKVTRECIIEIPIKVGDVIEYYEAAFPRKGKITYIFDGGNRAIVDDKDTVFLSYISSINNVKVKDIKGKVILI